LLSRKELKWSSAFAFGLVIGSTAQSQPADEPLVFVAQVVEAASFNCEARTTYFINDAMASYINVSEDGAAMCRVSANVPYIFTVEFPAWVPTGSTGGSAQARFTHNSVSIGGELWLKTPSNGSLAQGGGSGDTVVYMDPSASPVGSIMAIGQPSNTEWGLGADIFPQFNDAHGGIPPAGTYSLNAVITISPIPQV